MKSSVPLRLLLLCAWIQASIVHLPAADTNVAPRFNIRGYLVSDTTLLTSTNVMPMLSNRTGTNVGLEEIVRAAADLQSEYIKRGYPTAGVAVGVGEITNGIVTMHIFQSTIPQIRISGKRYIFTNNEVTLAANLMGPESSQSNIVSTAKSIPPKISRPVKPPTAEEVALHEKMAELDAKERVAHIAPQPPPTTQMVAPPIKSIETNSPLLALHQKMIELDNAEVRSQMLPETNSVPPATNGPLFEVKGYEVTGNTLLSSNQVELILRPFISTNMTLERLRTAVSDLQTVYRERGFATASVTLPQQTLSDKIVRIRVFEGRLSEIMVMNNHYFSSNNIMRALPGLRDNMILVNPLFQAELDRANANQDRTIYPKIEPGPVENTTELDLEVKDRLPLHAKVELNNQNTPGSPDLRLNVSAAYDNLWQMEHSMGVQYGFSPELYKPGSQWNDYDKPFVANYGGFYRFPIGSQEPIEQIATDDPVHFGYDEATRKFNLPAPSGRPEINVYASGSSVDTGLTTLLNETLFHTNGNSLVRQTVQRDLTKNDDLGMRFSLPSDQLSTIQSTFSSGFDFKTFNLESFKTNIFTLKQIEVSNPGGGTAKTNIIISVVRTPIPSNGVSQTSLEYLPLSLRYDANWRLPQGTLGFGLGVTHNFWYSGTRNQWEAGAGSLKAGGYWTTFTPSFSADIFFHTNWTLSLRLDSQLATEPLISNEQYGGGGVNSVRGYHEGEVFGDNGWHASVEIKTPARTVGAVYGKNNLVIRGSAFTDGAQLFLEDPQGRPGITSLWGVGVGAVATVGPHWETRFIFALPLVSTPTTPFLQPHFNFALTAQF